MAPKSIQRLKDKLKPVLRRGRGTSLSRTIRELTPIVRGWVVYFRMTEVKNSLEAVDQWLRRKLRLCQAPKLR